MKIPTIFLVLLIKQMFPFVLAAQTTGGEGSRHPALKFAPSTFGANLPTKEASASKTIGTLYIDDDWNEGEIHLINKQIIKGFPLKYDIKNNILEVKVHTKIKVCPSSTISKFYWQSENDIVVKQFINCAAYKLNSGIPLVGFFEVIYGIGKRYKLFTKTNLEIIKPNYNVLFDAGNKDSKIVKKDQYYLIDGNTAYLLTKNKNKNLLLFQQKESLIKNYMKENKLNFNKKKDLIKILIYYNSLAD